MATIKCGKCKGTHATVAEVKACYSAQTLPSLETPTTQALAAKYVKVGLDVPNSHYALETAEGIKFYEVSRGKAGSKWATFTFVSHLVGHPGTWMKYPVKGAAKVEVLSAIATDALAAAQRYATEFTVCAKCGSPLSDPDSIHWGLGPDCRKAFA